MQNYLEKVGLRAIIGADARDACRARSVLQTVGLTWAGLVKNHTQCARTWFGAPSFIFPENATFVLAHVQSRLEALGSLCSGLTKAFECPRADSATLVSSIPGPGLSPV